MAISRTHRTTSSEISEVANSATDQPCRSANIKTIVALIKGGSFPHLGRVGIEIEHFIAHDDLTAVTYSEPHGIKFLLEQLHRRGYVRADYNENHDILGCSRTINGYTESITIEPGAQLELSAGPFSSLDQANACFEAFDTTVQELIAPYNQQLLLYGYRPKQTADSIELIPKQRYRCMDSYLGSLSSYGPRMMRGSASTQVSIDYENVHDCLRKFRLAQQLVPLLSLITDNAPMYEGKPSPHHMMRTEIWHYCDRDRCDTIPAAYEPDYTLEAYATHILDIPAIVAHDDDGDHLSIQTFGNIYASTPMTKADAIHALSMVFHDVRLKTYIEIRPADAMPIPYSIAYAALIKGAFANESTLSQLEQIIGPVGGADVAAAKENLMARGYKALLYGRPVGMLAKELARIAADGLDESERHYLEPLKKLIENETTLAQQAHDSQKDAPIQ